jgi:hypothetical protein
LGRIEVAVGLGLRVGELVEEGVTAGTVKVKGIVAGGLLIFLKSDAFEQPDMKR